MADALAALQPLSVGSLQFTMDRGILAQVSRLGALEDANGTCAARSTLSGPGEVEVSRVAHFTIVSRDRQGKNRGVGGDAFVVELVGGEIKVSDNKDGSYDVSLLATRDGELSVRLRGEHVQGSPLRVQVSRARAPEYRFVRKWAQEARVKASFHKPMDWRCPAMEKCLSPTTATTEFRCSALTAPSFVAGARKARSKEILSIRLAWLCSGMRCSCSIRRITAFKSSVLWGSYGSAAGQFGAERDRGIGWTCLHC